MSFAAPYLFMPIRQLAECKVRQAPESNLCRVSQAASHLSKLHDSSWLLESRSDNLHTLRRERHGDKHGATWCQSQNTNSPHQSDCIFHLLSGDRGCDMTVKCAIQRLVCPFEDVFLKPGVILWLYFLSDGSSVATTRNSTQQWMEQRQTAIREALQEIVGGFCTGKTQQHKDNTHKFRI